MEQLKVEPSIKYSDLTEEKLSKELISVAQLALEEQDKVAKEILQRAETEKVKKLVTSPSDLALSTTKHEAGSGINRVKKTVKQLFTLYLTNQYVARAIGVRADTLVCKGYKIIGSDAGGVKLCQELIEKSGGPNLFWQLSVNTDIAGDGFLEKIYSQDKKSISRLKHVHPLTLEFKKDEESDKIIVGPDKEPVGYVQYFMRSDGVEDTQDVPKESIAHLRFNALGDEFTGISVIQPGYDTIVRLMNMEYSAAEAAVKTANPLIVCECNTKSPMQIAQWGTILGRISGKDQLFVPEGMKISFMSPGQQNFSEYGDYFLNAVVACFGVPKGVLLGDSGGRGNRSEGVILSRHFYSLIRSNQKYMEEFVNKIFEEYSVLSGFTAPKLVFEDIAEDTAVSAEMAVKLFEVGIISKNEARQMIGLEEVNETDAAKPQDVVAAEQVPSLGNSTAKAVKKADMEATFPESPGKLKGSQKGIKKAQKTNPYSEVSPMSE